MVGGNNEKVKKHYERILPDSLINDIDRLPLKDLNVLIIEDHAFVTELIIKVFKKIEEKKIGYNFRIDNASALEVAYKKLSQSLTLKEKRYDLIMLDIQMPAYTEKGLLSGEDLGAWIREAFTPNPMIIVTTTYHQRNKIMSIVKSVNPKGLIIKSDIDSKSFGEAIQKSIEEPPFYTSTVAKIMQQTIIPRIKLNETEYKMLRLLDEGANIAELMRLLHMSRSTHDRKRNRLMEKFGITDKSVMKLLAAAKSQHYI